MAKSKREEKKEEKRMTRRQETENKSCLLFFDSTGQHPAVPEESGHLNCQEKGRDETIRKLCAAIPKAQI